jgi:hypothetical protein
MMDKNVISDEVDVAVVGAGVSGAYVAWQLDGANPRNTPLEGLTGSGGRIRVGLYDAGNRVGGRILTKRMPQLPNVAVEMGAYGFMRPPGWSDEEGQGSPGPQPPQYQGHWRMASLVHHFGLKTDEFSFGGGTNPYYLRKKHFLQSDFGSPDQIPYALSWAEGINLGNLQNFAFDKIVPNASQIMWYAWPEIKRQAKWRGEYLYNLSIGEVLRDVLSVDAYSFLLDTQSVDSLLTTFNAADAIPWTLVNGLQYGFMHVRDGYELVPQNMVRQLSPGCYRPDHRLDQVRQGEDGWLYLRFRDRPREVRTRYLILAMPRAALEALANESPIFQGPKAAQFRQDLPSVQPQAILRDYICYPYPWWRRLGITSGFGITDLSVRTTVALETQGEQPGAPDKDDQHSLFERSYRGKRAQEQWGRMDEAQRANMEIQLETALQEEIKLVYGLDYIPQPVGAPLRKLWSGWPYGGAVNEWQKGCKSWEVAERMLKPIAGASLFICGEAYSECQGWSEGALETAAKVLQRAFNVPDPDWMRPPPAV